MKYSIVLVVGTVLLMAWSCKKSEIKNDVLSVSNFDTLTVIKDTTSVSQKDTTTVRKDTTSISKDIPCSSLDTLNFSIIKDFIMVEFKKGYVIKDNAYYKKFRDSIQSIYNFNTCDTTLMPQIDFNKYTLIGFGTDVPYKNDKQVVADVCNKKYTYTITKRKVPTGEGINAAIFIQSMNWVLVPKIPTDFRVVFNVIKEE